MKKLLFLLTLVLSVSSAQVRAQQQFVSDTLLQTYTKSQVDSLFSEIGVPSILPVSNGLEIYRIRYKMLDTNGDTTLVSGALARPTNLSCSAPLVSYSHGTTTKKRNVPSYFNSQLQLGIILGGMGFYVTLPDYLGLGISDKLHPYLHGETEAMSVIQLLRASRTFASKMNDPLNEQLFLFGYSQGGHSAMAAHRKIEKQFSNEFNVTASAPMSGPYDMSGVMKRVMLNDSSTYPRPAYLPYVFFGFEEAYGNILQKPEDVFIPGFDTLLRPLYNGQFSLTEIADSTDMDQPPVNNIPIKMVEDSIVQNFLNNKNHPLKVALRDNDTWRNWSPKAPIRLYFCTADGQVNFQNSIVAFDSLKAQGATIDTVSSGAKSHNGCVNPSVTKAFIWFLSERKQKFYLDVDVVTVPAASNDGRAVVTPKNKGVDLSYSWSNGDTDSTLENVSAGNYSVTITRPATGCSKVKQVTIQKAVGIADAANKDTKLQAFPNPSNNGFRIQLSSGNFRDNSALKLFNTTGELVKRIDASGKSQVMIDGKELSHGIYILKYQRSNAVKHMKLVKN